MPKHQKRTTTSKTRRPILRYQSFSKTKSIPVSMACVAFVTEFRASVGIWIELNLSSTMSSPCSSKSFHSSMFSISLVSLAVTFNDPKSITGVTNIRSANWFGHNSDIARSFIGSLVKFL
jgi:hypothetical protein